MRLIDADALIDQAINGIFPKLYNQLCFCPKDIDHAPTIDPVKHGKWIKGKEDGIPYCDWCNENAVFTSGHHYACGDYCPNCGAKMDGEV